MNPNNFTLLRITLLRILLLVGCFALCWLLYYILELTLTHMHWHGLRRGASNAKDGQFLEMQPLTDLEAKMPLIGNDDDT
ncbi:proprotein convertase subtilisin/kexin type 7 [Tachysurus ichikawai]